MDRRKLTTLLIAAVILGLGIEVLKGVDGLGVRKSPTLSQLDVGHMDAHPFHVQLNAQEDITGRPAARAAKGFSLAAYNEFDGQHEFGKKKSGRDKLADKSKDKKKKKKKKKSKQAKKKKDDGKGLAEVYAEKKKPEAPEAADAGTDQVYAAAAPVAEAKKDANLEEWARLLLGRPDKELTVRFIRAYQSGKVSVEVFYTIVESMYNEDMAEFKSLAILAAGAAPSMRSFNFLVKAYGEQSNGSSLQAQAQTELRDYSSIQYLWIPRGFLSGASEGDLTTALISASAMDLATSFYLGDRSAASTEDDDQAQNQGEASRRITLHAAQLQYFSGLIPVLESAIETYKNEQSITSPLEAALGRIRQAGLVAYNEAP